MRAMQLLSGVIMITMTSAAWFARPATSQIYSLPRTDAAPGDFFGVSVALDGDRVLVGATGTDSCGDNSGAAYIYARDDASGRWQLESTLQPSDCEAGLYFGRSLDLVGNTAVVGAFRSTASTIDRNAAYVFERDTTSGEWRQTAKLTGGLDQKEGPFAADVAADSARIVVTTAGDLSEGKFGGAAYVFEPNGVGSWRRGARLTTRSGTNRGVLGGSVDISGDRIVVSASRYFQQGQGSLYVFEADDTGRNWKESVRLDGFEDFFIQTRIADDQIIVGESKAGRNSEGRATVYVFDNDRWRREVVLSPTHPFELGAFGSDVALEGDRAIVVGYDEQLKFEFNIDRVVYVFERESVGGDEKRWSQTHVIDVGNVYFGSAIDLDENAAAIGQASEEQPGSVVIVQLH